MPDTCGIGSQGFGPDTSQDWPLHGVLQDVSVGLVMLQIIKDDPRVDEDLRRLAEVTSRRLLQAVTRVRSFSDSASVEVFDAGR